MKFLFLSLLAAAPLASWGLVAVPSVVRARRGVVRPAAAEVWELYLHSLETAPLLTKCATATCIIGAGDAAAQLVEASRGGEPSTGVDLQRVARWALFGLVLQAPWNHFWNGALESALPGTPSPWTGTTALKVGIDQFLQAPIFTAVIFLFFALVEGRGVADARRQIEQDLWPTMVKNWLIFVPATVVNLGLVPLELRVLFINCIFFFWVIILSLLINESKAEEAN